MSFTVTKYTDYFCPDCRGDVTNCPGFLLFYPVYKLGAAYSCAAVLVP